MSVGTCIRSRNSLRKYSKVVLSRKASIVMIRRGMDKIDTDDIKTVKSSALIWIAIYSILFVAVSAFLNKLSLLESLYAVSYYLFVYAIPGMAIILLLGLRVSTDVGWIGYTFVSGYCYNILVYYITVPFGLQRYIGAISAALAILSILIIYKKRESLVCMHDSGGMKICTVGVACYALLMFIAYNGTGLTPDLVGKSDYYTYHRDVLYWIGNLNSLIKQYPPIDPREYANGTFNYHYFSSVQLAVQCLVTGIDTVVTCIGLYFYSTVVMIIFGTYLFASKILKNNKEIILAMCALLVTSGVESITKIEQVANYALASIGADYGLGILLFLMLALHQYSLEPLKIRGAVCVILLAVLTATKGPYAAIAVCGIGVMCLFWLIQKKCSRAFVFGGSSLSAFCVVYYFVCNVRGYIGSEDYSSFYHLVIRTDPDMSMAEACLYKLGREIRNLVLMKPIIILPLIALMLIVLYRRKRLTLFEFCCLCMAIVGLAINAIITMPSNQQTYLALAALVPAWCFVLLVGEKCRDIIIGQRKWLRWVTAGLLLFGIICFIFGYTRNGNRFNVIYSIEDGIKAIKCRITGEEAKVDDEEYLETGRITNREEYENLTALSKDGELSAIILYAIPEDKRAYSFFRTKIIGSFSGKYIMCDDKALNGLIEGDAEEYNRLLDMGVCYILIDFCKESDITVPNAYARMIYEGEQIKIYEMIRYSSAE